MANQEQGLAFTASDDSMFCAFTVTGAGFSVVGLGLLFEVRENSVNINTWKVHTAQLKYGKQLKD